jgi:hypothetical protein
MSIALDNQPTQAFRFRAGDEVIHIPTIQDAMTGQRIVLWSDIEDVFVNAKFIRNKRSLVPFLKDESFTR